MGKTRYDGLSRKGGRVPSTHQRSELAMSDQHIRFPFSTLLDFTPLVDFWREQVTDPEGPWSTLASEVLAQVEGIPELTGPVEGPEQLEAHQDGIESLMTAFASPLGSRRFIAAIAPWRIDPAYMSPVARRADLIGRMDAHFKEMYDPEEMSVFMTMKAYGVILEEIYGIRSGFELPFSWVSFRDVDGTVPIPCPTTKIVRRFSVDFDSRFVKAEVVGERPEVSSDEVAALAGDPSALDRLMELLPPENFAFRGVTMLVAEDVTAEAALTAIRDDLLLKDALTSEQGVLHIQEHVRAFMGRADLELGLIGCESGETVEALVGGRAVGRSLLFSDGDAPECPTRAKSFYAKALRSRQAVVVDDLDEVRRKTGFEYHLAGQGLRSLMVLPLITDDSIIGVLELASTMPDALRAVNIFKLEKIQGLFALGLKRSVEELEDRIQAIIKRDYTAIHPVVEWRFRAAARNRMMHELRGEAEGAEEIIFPDLIPLYGLSDIRGSSSLRNEAIVSDLLDQLELASNVIKAAQSEKPQPALGQLGFRLTRYIESLHPEMATEDESSIAAFLTGQIEPLFEELARLDPVVAKKVEAYQAAIDPELGMLYDQRKRFEDSVGLLNEIIAGALHDQDGYAQTLVPHFFELFKTDGVDYNIYVGPGLHEARRHEVLDLANLRLWQLMTMCRIDWALQERRDELPMPLEVTHLILVQSRPLAVRFRRDEKRFDVDGAYNVRYEIVKKRIDKATIRETGERLTQPGLLAIAYSQDDEAAEYRGYLEYLRSAGFVEGDIEELELEDLQGVFGLKALRVRVASVQGLTEEPSLPEEIESITGRLAIPSG